MTGAAHMLKNGAVSAGRAKKQILEATTRLLSSGGKAAATARAICAEVGVGAPTIYYYFGDLAGLHRAAIDVAFGRVATRYQEGARSGGALQGIKDSWSLFISFAFEEPQMCRLLIQQVVDDVLPASLSKTLTRLTADLAGLSLKCPPNVGAQMLWTAAIGAATLATLADERQRIDVGICDAMLEAILSAILVDPLAAGHG